MKKILMALTVCLIAVGAFAHGRGPGGCHPGWRPGPCGPGGWHRPCGPGWNGGWGGGYWGPVPWDGRLRSHRRSFWGGVAVGAAGAAVVNSWARYPAYGVPATTVVTTPVVASAPVVYSTPVITTVPATPVYTAPVVPATVPVVPATTVVRPPLVSAGVSVGGVAVGVSAL